MLGKSHGQEFDRPQSTGSRKSRTRLVTRTCTHTHGAQKAWDMSTRALLSSHLGSQFIQPPQVTAIFTSLQKPPSHAMGSLIQCCPFCGGNVRFFSFRPIFPSYTPHIQIVCLTTGKMGQKVSLLNSSALQEKSSYCHCPVVSFSASCSLPDVGFLSSWGFCPPADIW